MRNITSLTFSLLLMMALHSGLLFSATLCICVSFTAVNYFALCAGDETLHWPNGRRPGLDSWIGKWHWTRWKWNKCCESE